MVMSKQAALGHCEPFRVKKSGPLRHKLRRVAPGAAEIRRDAVHLAVAHDRATDRAAGRARRVIEIGVVVRPVRRVGGEQVRLVDYTDPVGVANGVVPTHFEC